MEKHKIKSSMKTTGYKWGKKKEPLDYNLLRFKDLRF